MDHLFVADVDGDVPGTARLPVAEQQVAGPGLVDGDLLPDVPLGFGRAGQGDAGGGVDREGRQARAVEAATRGSVCVAAAPNVGQAEVADGRFDHPPADTVGQGQSDERCEQLREGRLSAPDLRHIRFGLVLVVRAAWHVCLQITGNTHDAEDALQDTLTAAWQNLPKFRGDARFNTWLHRIAANAALAVVRRRKNSDSLDDSDGEYGILLEDPAPRFDEQVTTIDAVRRALAQLPEDFRVAIVLAEFAALPYADIAEHQGVTVATVKTRIHRARKQLATLLTPALDL